MVAWELEVEFSDSAEDGDDGEQYGAVVVDDVVVVVVKVVGEVEEVIVEVVCNFLCLSMIFPKSCDGLGKMLRLVS